MQNTQITEDTKSKRVDHTGRFEILYKGHQIQTSHFDWFGIDLALFHLIYSTARVYNKKLFE